MVVSSAWVVCVGWCCGLMVVFAPVNFGMIALFDVISLIVDVDWFYLF